MIVLVSAAMLPILRKKRTPKGTEDWPDEKPSDQAKSAA